MCNRSTRENTRTEVLSYLLGHLSHSCTRGVQGCEMSDWRQNWNCFSFQTNPPCKRDAVPLMGKQGTFPRRAVGGIPWGELRSKLSFYPLEQF